LNLEFLIAKRLGSASGKSFSRSILRLSVIAIALSMMVMILATSIVSGFKNTISDKIFGFWGHIHITSSYSPSSYAFETSPMNAHQDFYPSIDTVGRVSYNMNTTDWADTLIANIFHTNIILSIFLLILSIILLFGPEFLKRKMNQSTRASLAIFFTAISAIMLLMHEYQITEKDTHYETKGGIRHIQYYIHKEGIIKTKDQIEGIVLRGVGEDYDWEFLQQYISEGSILNTGSAEAEKGILISETTAKRLKLKPEDNFLIYFVKEDNSLARKFKVQGIYKTGLEEYDKRFALVDVRTLQQLNNWRPYHNFGTELDLPEERVTIKGLTSYTSAEDGGWKYVKENIREGKLLNFDDSTSLQAIIPHQVAYTRKLSLGDSILLRYEDSSNEVYTLEYEVAGIYEAPQDINIKKTIFVNWWSLENLNKKLPPQISGFEIFVDDLADLDAFGNYTNYVVLLGKEQYANTIKELEPNIFDWLSLTDMNERIILLLMILVSIINMTTSLMILILERTNMIGILKALGAQNWTIRKVFLYNASYIIGYGLFWGNLIGVGLCFIQMQFGIITLPEDLYYVSVAPVELNWLTILLLNIGTMAITLIVLIIPSWLVARIDPVKAIRFS
jgi:lipoprotein-releasing system permease protein